MGLHTNEWGNNLNVILKFCQFVFFRSVPFHHHLSPSVILCQPIIPSFVRCTLSATITAFSSPPGGRCVGRSCLLQPTDHRSRADQQHQQQESNPTMYACVCDPAHLTDEPKTIDSGTEAKHKFHNQKVERRQFATPSTDQRTP